jgi:hypothetical protein
MDSRKRKALEAAGWRVGDYGDLLGLSKEERREVELRGELGHAIRRRRKATGLTPKQLASKLRIRLSEVTNLELGFDVSLDLMFRALFILGGQVADIAPSKPKRRKQIART